MTCRGRQRDDQRDLHRQRSARRAGRPSRSTTRPPTARATRRPTTRRERHAHVRPGRDLEDGHRARRTATLLDESDETFRVNLADAGERDDRRRRGHRHDHRRRRAAVAISIDDVDVTEGNAGTVSATFTVTLSAPSGRTVTRRLRDRGRDRHRAGRLPGRDRDAHLRPRPDDEQVTVHVNGDLLDEANETFFVNLTNAANATIADGQGLGTITERRRAAQPVRQRRNGDRGRLGHDQRHLHRHAARRQRAGRSLSDYSTADGTATAPADYAATSGTLTFAPGQTTRRPSPSWSRRHARRARRDLHGQPLERGQRDDRRRAGLGTIRTTTPLPALSINDVTVTEGDAGTTSATFTVSLNAPSGQHGHGRLRDRGRHGDRGRPTTPPARGTLTFAAGETTKTVTVPSTATCSTRRTRRSSSTSRTRRTRRSPTARAWARSPTTTRAGALDRRRHGHRGRTPARRRRPSPSP